MATSISNIPCSKCGNDQFKHVKNNMSSERDERNDAISVSYVHVVVKEELNKRSDSITQRRCLKMWNFLKNNKTLSAILLVMGYLLHIIVEALIVNTIAAFAGFKLPVLIPIGR